MRFVGLAVTLPRWWIGHAAGAVARNLRVGQFWFLEACSLSFWSCRLSPAGTSCERLEAPRQATAREPRLRRGRAVLVAPRTNRIFYDEQIYQAIGQNLSDLHLAQMCNDGTLEYGTLQCSDTNTTSSPTDIRTC